MVEQQTVGEATTSTAPQQSETDKDEQDIVELPALTGNSVADSLGISVNELQKQQKACDNLKEIWGKIGKATNFKVLKNGILVKTRKNKFNEDVNLIVIPKMFIQRVMSAGHEGVSCHLGSTKTNDKVVAVFLLAGML